MIWLMKIIPILKIAGIFLSISVLGYAGYKFIQFHNNAVEQAVQFALLEENAKQQRKQQIVIEQLKTVAEEDRLVLEQQILIERNKTRELEKMLLIEHDLDRLLQQKPGLILSRVNNGTAEYFKNLEEASQ